MKFRDWFWATMAYLGLVVVWLWITGAVGLIDFHVCIKAAGQCP